MFRTSIFNSMKTSYFNMRTILIVLLFFIGLNTNNVYSQSQYEGYSQQSIEKLKSIDAQILSQRTKRDWIKGNPEEDALAINEGWYEKNAETLKILFNQKRTIIREETGKDFVWIEKYENSSPETKIKMMDESKFIIEQH